MPATVRGTRRRRRGVGRELLLQLFGLDEAGRRWLGGTGDGARRSRKGADGLDPARGGERDKRRASRRHGGQNLERISLGGVGGSRVAGTVAGHPAPTVHAWYHVRTGGVAVEQAEGTAHDDRLGHQKGGQGGEGEAAGAKGSKHRSRT